MSTTRPRTLGQQWARLEARIPPEQKELLQRAAALEGESLTSFVLRSAQERTKETIRERQVMTLSAADSAAFTEAILSPPEPSEALVETLRSGLALRRE